MDDPLARFVEAQERDWEQARRELAEGRKRTHWIWYVLPQLAGLGASTRARHFGLSGLEEARAYLAHPVLGPRLVEAAGLILSHADTPAEEIMGSGIDAIKLRSSMTLFAAVEGAPAVFAEVLRACFDGNGCPRTLALI